MTLDVRRQGHFAERIEFIENIFRPGKLEPAMAIVVDPDDLAGEAGALAGFGEKLNLCTHFRPFSRPHHHPPVVDYILFEQKNFKLAACFWVLCVQTGRNHPRIVQHQHVPGSKKFNKILKSPVFDAMVGAMQNQQFGLIAVRRWFLGNQLRRQMKMKVGGSHGSRITGRGENGQFTIAEANCE